MSGLNIFTLGAGALGPGRIVVYGSHWTRGACVAVVEVYRPVMVGEPREDRRDGRYVWTPIYTTGVGSAAEAQNAALDWWKERA